MAIDLKAIINDVEKTATDIGNKAQKAVVKVIDVNGDGKFDMSDIKNAADSVGDAAQNAVASVKNAIENSEKERQEKLKDRKRKSDLKELSPIFPSDIQSPDFYLTKLIRITEIDKRHAESEACNGSIGYVSKTDEMNFVNIYKNYTDQFGLSFYPDKESDIYYVNPVDRDHYIALEDYYRYLKIARVNELQRIAQDLGATHFSVKYYESKSGINKRAVKDKAKVGPAKVDVDVESVNTNQTHMTIAAEMDCLGHEPREPKLHYLAKESVIQNLIALRMHGEGMKRQKYTLKLSDSSGVKMKDAIKIEAALKKVKASESLTIVNDTEKESTRYFEYTTEF